MTLQELRYIVALADTLHFGKAAEACFISQSTLSAQIKKLEEYLGAPLFDRSLKQVTLTPAGREIVASARLILEEANRIRELARQTLDPMERTVQLGVIPTLGPYYLPHVLTLLHGKFPRLRLLLREEMTPQVMGHLADGKLDAGLLALPVNDPTLETVPLFREPFLAAVPASHPLAGMDSVPISALVDAGLLLLEEGHCLRDQTLAVGQAAGASALDDFRASSLATVVQMVANGYGCTILPELAVPVEVGDRQGIHVVPFKQPPPVRTVGLAWRRTSPRRDEFVAFGQVVLEALGKPPIPASEREHALVGEVL